MSGDLKIRRFCTSSGAMAVQVIRYDQGNRIVVRHIGSAHTDGELGLLYDQAKIVREQLCRQLSLFVPQQKATVLLNEAHLQLQTVTYCFAHQALKACRRQYGLDFLHALYQDLALMRIIEPASNFVFWG